MTWSHFCTPEHSAEGVPDPAAQRYQVLRLAIKLTADSAVRCDDAAHAASYALASLRAEPIYRFDLLRSRQRMPALAADPIPMTFASESAAPPACPNSR